MADASQKKYVSDRELPGDDGPPEDATVRHFRPPNLSGETLHILKFDPEGQGPSSPEKQLLTST